MNFHIVLLSSVVYPLKRFVIFTRTLTLTRTRTRNLLNRFEYEWECRCAECECDLLKIILLFRSLSSTTAHYVLIILLFRILYSATFHYICIMKSTHTSTERGLHAYTGL
jgi:hypothetical protein